MLSQLMCSVEDVTSRKAMSKLVDIICEKTWNSDGGESARRATYLLIRSIDENGCESALQVVCDCLVQHTRICQEPLVDAGCVPPLVRMLGSRHATVAAKALRFGYFWIASSIGVLLTTSLLLSF